MEKEESKCHNCDPSLILPGGVIKATRKMSGDYICPECGKSLPDGLDLYPSNKTPIGEAMEKTKRWDARFLRVCEELATWSNCLSRQIGAILVRDYTIISTGFNGPPRGIPHCGEDGGVKNLDVFYALRTAKDRGLLLGDKTMCPRQRLGFPSGKGLFLCPAAHGEDNCISNAARIGVVTMHATMYINCGVPCKDCLKKIINAGIDQLVCTSEEHYDEQSKFLLDNSSVFVRTYVN